MDGAEPEQRPHRSTMFHDVDDRGNDTAIGCCCCSCFSRHGINGPSIEWPKKSTEANHRPHRVVHDPPLPPRTNNNNNSNTHARASAFDCRAAERARTHTLRVGNKRKQNSRRRFAFSWWRRRQRSSRLDVGAPTESERRRPDRFYTPTWPRPLRSLAPPSSFVGPALAPSPPPPTGVRVALTGASNSLKTRRHFFQLLLYCFFFQVTLFY